MRRSRRYDRNAYIKRPIWSLDEEVMPLGRPAPESDRSNRSKGDQTVDGPVNPVYTDQSDLRVVF